MATGLYGFGIRRWNANGSSHWCDQLQRGIPNTTTNHTSRSTVHNISSPRNRRSCDHSRLLWPPGPYTATRATHPGITITHNPILPPRYHELLDLSRTAVVNCFLHESTRLRFRRGHIENDLCPGVHVKLFAGEPGIRQPILVKHGPRGRLWTIQYLRYPKPID